MRGTPPGQATPAMAAWLTRALGLVFWIMTGAQAFAEDVVIPYECDVRMGDVRLVPSEPRNYRIVGTRDRQIYSACDPQDPNECKNYQIHRFDVDCGGSRVPWLKIVEAAARLDGERVSVKRNQMLLEIEPRKTGDADPYPDQRWDPDRRSSGDPYGVAQGEAVVSFPPGFAPALGLKPVFTGRDPALTQQMPPAQGTTGRVGTGYGVPYDGAEQSGWETQANGWSESPRGEPVDPGAERGWDAERVIAGSEGTPKPAAKSPPAVTKPNATVAGAKTAGASYGTETVTSQQLPEIGAKSAAKKTAVAVAPEAAKTVQKKPAAKPAEPAASKVEAPKQEIAKAEPPKTEPPKTEPPKTEPPKTEVKTPKPEVKSEQPPEAQPAKAETPKVEEPKAEAAKVEPPKVEEKAPPAAPVDAPRAETAMLEPPKPEAKPDTSPPENRPPASAEGAHPERPELLNGKDAVPLKAATTEAMPPAVTTTVPASTPADPQPQTPPQAASAPDAAQPTSAPEQTTVVAEAALKPQEAPSNIETSSISIAGQNVPLAPSLFLGAAALFTAAGFYFMMRRGQEVEVGSYVERDFTRVTLGASGESAPRLAGPSFELPMPEFAAGPPLTAGEAEAVPQDLARLEDVAANPVFEAPAAPPFEPHAVMPEIAAPQGYVGDVSPLVQAISAELAAQAEAQAPLRPDVPDAIEAHMPPFQVFAEAVAADSNPPAPEAVELARALAESEAPVRDGEVPG